MTLRRRIKEFLRRRTTQRITMKKFDALKKPDEASKKSLMGESKGRSWNYCSHNPVSHTLG